MNTKSERIWRSNLSAPSFFLGLGWSGGGRPVSRPGSPARCQVSCLLPSSAAWKPEPTFLSQAIKASVPGAGPTLQPFRGSPCPEGKAPTRLRGPASSLAPPPKPFPFPGPYPPPGPLNMLLPLPAMRLPSIFPPLSSWMSPSHPSSLSMKVATGSFSNSPVGIGPLFPIPMPSTHLCGP